MRNELAGAALLGGSLGQVDLRKEGGASAPDQAIRWDPFDSCVRVEAVKPDNRGAELSELDARSKTATPRT